MKDKLRESTYDKGKYRVSYVLICKIVLVILFVIGIIYYRNAIIKEKPIDLERQEERLKIRDDILKTESNILESYSWQDKTKGIVQLPIRRAMEILADYKDSWLARSNLLNRLEGKTPQPVKTYNLQ